MTQIQNVSDAEALKAHFESEFNKNVQPELDGLRARLKEVVLDCTTGAFHVQVASPPTVDSFAKLASIQIDPLLLAGGALALSLIPMIRDKRAQARETVAASPVAWLLHLQEDLSPASLTAKVKKAVRRFALGV